MNLYRRQFRRLVEFDSAIRSGKYPNCASFARQYEVSPRTIWRDKELLLETGAPLAFDSRKNGFYYTDASWPLPVIHLTEGELLQLILAERMAAQYRGTPLARTLGTLFEKISARLTDPISLDPGYISEQVSFHTAPTRPISEKTWTTVLRALRGCRVLRIQYFRPDWSQVLEMEIEPIHLANLAGEWHLVARHHGETENHQFAMSRMQSAAISRKGFERGEFRPEEFFRDRFGRFVDPEGKTHRVEVRFTPDAAPWVQEREWHRKQEVRQHRDGSITLAFPAPNLEEVKAWVLRWGAEAQVIKPRSLVETLAKEVGRLRRLYSC